MAGDDEKPREVPDPAVVSSFDPADLRADKSYCPMRDCPEWNRCQKRLFPFVKMFCSKL